MEVFEESDEYCPHCDNHFVRLTHSRMVLYRADQADAAVRLWMRKLLKQFSKSRETMSGSILGMSRCPSALRSLALHVSSWYSLN